ncbi:MAG: response regulator [Bdellovibrionales bacterium]|jgi:two-component system chemotaxis response regulator CheY|nr:response regulator [Bdellovibrionales bacterium]
MIRLLIVDDAPFIREIVRHAVRLGPIEVIGEAENGKEAVTLARALEPDVVLMDLVLPEKSGVDAAREILGERPETRIVAFSTNDHETVVMKALEAGCCSFIAKPFEAEALVEAIRQAVESKTA